MEKTGKLVLILLAAGDSRRFHGNKLLHQFQGKPMYRHLIGEIEKLPEGLFESKIIVTQYQEIADDLKTTGYQVAENHESELGISRSVQLGIEAAGKAAVLSTDESHALCFAVCDQPYLKAETILRLIEGFWVSGKGIGCLSHRGELGNPAIFSEKYREELLDLTGDVGGRKVIRRHLEDLFLCEVEDGKELVDIDVKAQEKTT